MAGPKREGMPCSGMIKLKFFKSMWDKITKKFQFYFSFILEYFFLKKDYMTQNISTVRRKEKDERKRKNKKEKRILHINHITYYIYHIY